MKNEVKFVSNLFIIAAILILQFGCQTKNGEDTNSKSFDENYLTELFNERTSKDSTMRYDPHSPFNRDPKAEYANLNYYEPGSEFIFTSKLYEYEPKDTVDVFGTRGELRRVIKLGYITASGLPIKPQVKKLTALEDTLILKKKTIPIIFIQLISTELTILIVRIVQNLPAQFPVKRII